MKTTLAPSGITYYLCPWDHGCNIPTSTNPTQQRVLCRWHAHCVRQDYPVQIAGDFAAFATWLEEQQHKYPGIGVWSWPVERLWPILKGETTAF